MDATLTKDTESLVPLEESRTVYFPALAKLLEMFTQKVKVVQIHRAKAL